MCIPGNLFPVCLFSAYNHIKGIPESYPDLFVLRCVVYWVLSNKLETILFIMVIDHYNPFGGHSNVVFSLFSINKYTNLLI